MADYVTSISTVGGLRTWWDTTVPATINSGDHYIAELAAGNYALNTVSLGWAKTVNGQITIRAATAARLTSPTRALRGSTSDGVSLSMTGFSFEFDASHIAFEGVQFISSDAGSVLKFNNSYAELRNCIVHGTVATVFGGTNSGAKDSVFVSNSTSFTTYTPSSNAYFENCTLVSFGAREALTVGAPDTLLKNCVLASLGATTDAVFVYSGSVAAASTNSSFSGGSTYGSSATTFTASSEFENVASFAAADLRLKSGSGLATTGAGSIGTGSDIYWQSRTTSYSRGAYELDAGGGGTTLVSANAAHGHTIDNLVLTSSHALTINNATHGHAIDNINLVFAGSTTLTVANVTHAHSTDNLALTIPGTLVSEPLKTNNGTLLASVALDFVAVYDDTTGALVVRQTGLSTNGSGVFSISDAALVAGTTYRVDWQTAGGQRRMPRKAAA